MAAVMTVSSVGLAAIEDRHLPALAHDQHAVAHRQHLGQVGRDHDDADPLGGELVDHCVDLRLGADVDAARRLIEDQHRRVGVEPFAQHHLLLVAAGKLGHGHVDRRRADRQALPERSPPSPAPSRCAPGRKQRDSA